MSDNWEEELRQDFANFPKEVGQRTIQLAQAFYAALSATTTNYSEEISLCLEGSAKTSDHAKEDL